MVNNNAIEKKQHQIPKFHLKPFANDSNEKSIGIYNLEHEKYIRNGPIMAFNGIIASNRLAIPISHHKCSMPQ